jgi:hypothetical protein
MGAKLVGPAMVILCAVRFIAVEHVLFGHTGSRVLCHGEDMRVAKSQHRDNTIVVETTNQHIRQRADDLLIQIEVALRLLSVFLGGTFIDFMQTATIP